jgi:hypothetical protein
MSKSWRQSREYRKWRVAVIRRDGRCFICNSIKRRHAHHLNHATFFPEQKFDVANGITLCSKCHMNLHCNYHTSYRHKCTEKSFVNHLSFIDQLFSNLGHIPLPFVTKFSLWRNVHD